MLQLPQLADQLRVGVGDGAGDEDVVVAVLEFQLESEHVLFPVGGASDVGFLDRHPAA